MSKLRPIVIFVALAVLGLLLIAWAVVEGQLQQKETAQALALQAETLASTLGPALTATAAASREVEELQAWRLLDHARLIARLHERGQLGEDELGEILDRGELDAVAIVDRTGALTLRAGDAIPSDVLEQMGSVWRADAEEVVLGTTADGGVEHLAAASALPGGGAVVVRIHVTSGRSFVRRVGVENLLVGLLESEDVLYLSFEERPDGLHHEVTWDEGPLPALPEGGSGLREVRGRSIFEVVVPVESPAGMTATLRVGFDGASLIRSAVSATRRTVLVGVVLAAFSLAVAGMALLARWRTIERVEAERRLSAAETARRRSERLASAGALAAGLAHEVRSPLNAIVVAAQRIERKQPDGECHRFATTIRSEVRRLDAVLRQFLELARPVSDDRERVDLHSHAEEVRELLRAEAEQVGLTIHPVQGSGAVVADPIAIRRSMINLVHNAMESSSSGGAIELLVSEEASGVAFRVLDRGCGIDESSAQELFDAFVTTRAEGTGLGLSLVRRVAEEHGGHCRLVNRSGGGAEATLWLPAASAARIAV